MTALTERFRLIRKSIPEEITLVAVSKYYTQEAISEVYNAGQVVFGESRVQELLPKYEVLPKDIEWHFIGHLQSNKVKYIAPFVSLIHAVDTEKLFFEINQQAERYGRVIRCLLQLHVAQEETKYGFTPQELEAFLCRGHWRSLHNIEIAGLMCMASNTDDANRIRQEFRIAKSCFDHLKDKYFYETSSFTLKSWGMSSDYTIAIEEGSNMVRVGSAIFANN